MQFLGEFECKVDVKGRVRLPSLLIKQLGDLVTDGFVVNRGFEQCLMLYTKKEWNKVSSDLMKLNQYDQKKRAFVRYFHRGAIEIKADASDRVLIPKRLLEYADIAKNMVVFAYLDKIELWSKESYDNLYDNEPNDFSDLAQTVMGDINVSDTKTIADE